MTAQSRNSVKLSSVLAPRTLSEEAKGLIGRMARMTLLLAVLKDLWMFWERLDHKMGKRSLGLIWMVLEPKQLSVVPILLTLGRSKPVGSHCVPGVTAYIPLKY